MNLNFNEELALSYKSKSQKIRIMSETWAKDNVYCTYCGNKKLLKLENNSPVADFICDKCGEIYELKSKNGNIDKKIPAGSYTKMIQRITSNTNPNLFVLQYEKSSVKNLVFIPKYFLTPNIIEKRQPLSPTAKRAGWIGCNILYESIPNQYKIYLIKQGEVINKINVINESREVIKLQTYNLINKGWLSDVLNCINLIDKKIFTLRDIYKFSNDLYKKHPDNRHVYAKIRQQLQLLRDKGYIQFEGNGCYSKNDRSIDKICIK